MEKRYIEKREEGYWVAGTRVSLDSIVLAAFLDGLSPETIVTECFPVLTLEQVYGAITYYLAHRAEIDRYLQQVDAEFDALRQATRSADPRIPRQDCPSTTAVTDTLPMSVRFQADADLNHVIVKATLRRESSIDFQTAHAAGLVGFT